MIILSILLSILVAYLAIEQDWVKALNQPWKTLIAAFVALAQLLINGLLQAIKNKYDSHKLQSENLDLHENLQTTKRALSDLERVFVNFIEYSEHYKSRVINLLGVAEDYVCIAKASEGLSDVFKAMEEKEMLPFGRVLKRIPGSLKPFERMAMFFIPISSLPGLNANNLKPYIDEKIIAAVRADRQLFLADLPPAQRKLADEFSYKYIAFFIRRNSIVFGAVNRKFQREFTEFLVTKTDKKNRKQMKSVLMETIRNKELFRIIDWRAFVALNEEREEAINKYRDQINQSLSNIGVAGLADLSAKTAEELMPVFKSVLKRSGLTERKIENLVKKIVADLSNLKHILSQNGIRY